MAQLENTREKREKTAGEVMTAHPTCCTPDMRVGRIAQLMVLQDCGEIPVVDDETSRVPVGVVTDRDIVCRLVAKGENPLDHTAADCMTSPVVTVDEDVAELVREISRDSAEPSR